MWLVHSNIIYLQSRTYSSRECRNTCYRFRLAWDLFCFLFLTTISFFLSSSFSVLLICLFSWESIKWPGSAVILCPAFVYCLFSCCFNHVFNWLVPGPHTLALLRRGLAGDFAKTSKQFVKNGHRSTFLWSPDLQAIMVRHKGPMLSGREDMDEREEISLPNKPLFYKLIEQTWRHTCLMGRKKPSNP